MRQSCFLKAVLPHSCVVKHKEMSEVLPELKDDQDMFDLLLSAMEKLKRISDDEYNSLETVSVKRTISEF